MTALIASLFALRTNHLSRLCFGDCFGIGAKAHAARRIFEFPDKRSSTFDQSIAEELPRQPSMSVLGRFDRPNAF